jgi:hypothetical protein
MPPTSPDDMKLFYLGVVSIYKVMVDDDRRRFLYQLLGTAGRLEQDEADRWSAKQEVVYAQHVQ